MESSQLSSLHVPSYLYGTLSSIEREAIQEGHRYGAQYLRDGSFPPPADLVEIPSGEVLIADEVVDFSPWQPAWRLYMLSKVGLGLMEATHYENVFKIGDQAEAYFQGMAFGALYYVTAPIVPRSAARTVGDVRAVLRFWEPLQSVRYLYKTLGTPHTLEEVMVAACDWVMDAWCPIGGSVRERLEAAVERMAHATRDDSMEAIFREIPRALASIRDLKHRDVLADPEVLRRRFAALDPESFERVSGACTGDIIAQLYLWDRQMEKE